MCMYICAYSISRSAGITVMFNQSSYNVDEHAGTAQATLIFNNPSSTNITV